MRFGIAVKTTLHELDAANPLLAASLAGLGPTSLRASHLARAFVLQRALSKRPYRRRLWSSVHSGFGRAIAGRFHFSSHLFDRGRCSATSPVRVRGDLVMYFLLRGSHGIFGIGELHSAKPPPTALLDAYSADL